MDAVNKSFIAHARQDEQGHWLEAHFLEDHLRDVAKIAEALASSFGSENWGRLAGQWHDLGKYQNAFQDYIREKSGYEKENAHMSYCQFWCLASRIKRPSDWLLSPRFRL